jgi:uncharacterized membrane protein YcjF (UPF0283 family)
MFLGFLAIIITDCMLYLVIRLVDSATTRKSALMPLHYAALLLVFCCVAHYGATATMARAIVVEADKWKVLAASALFGLIPVGAYVRTLLRHPTISKLTGRPGDFEAAQALQKRGDAAGAIRAYHAFFKAHPDRPDALFHAAAVLVTEKQDEKARALLHKLTKQFHDDPEVVEKAQRWVKHIQRGTAEFILGDAPAVQAAPAPEKPVDELAQLAALRRQGVITESEYASRRRSVLERPGRTGR